MTTFILVAGSFHGGWCWPRTATLLRDRGHTVFTPSLTGMGERAHLTTSAGIRLATHVDDVLALVDAEELSEVVLVAVMSRAAGEAGMAATYVYCTIKPRADLFTEFAARTEADPGWSYVEVAGPHDCMITHPVETAAVLAAL